jgi:hypothetical protein
MGGAPVLGGQLLKERRDNQPINGVGGGAGIGEVMPTGGTRGEGCLPIVSGGEWSDKKKKIERAMGPRNLMTLLNGKTQQPTKSRPYRWSIFGLCDVQGKDNWGGRRHTFLAFGLWDTKINKMKFVMALEGHQSMIPHNNQPNERVMMREN